MSAFTSFGLLIQRAAFAVDHPVARVTKVGRERHGARGVGHVNGGGLPCERQEPCHPVAGSAALAREERPSLFRVTFLEEGVVLGALADGVLPGDEVGRDVPRVRVRDRQARHGRDEQRAQIVGLFEEVDDPAAPEALACAVEGRRLVQPGDALAPAHVNLARGARGLAVQVARMLGAVSRAP